jgi:predicted amidohydrolase
MIGATKIAALQTLQMVATPDVDRVLADRVRNSCCVYGPDGQRVARYDKIHLYDFDNGRER